MPAFGDLLLLYLERRKFSRLEFSKRVGLSDTAIGNVIQGKSAPRFKHARRWVSVLELTDAETREFMLEWQLAMSPDPVRRLVKQLRERVRDLERGSG